MNKNLKPIAESLKRSGFAFVEADVMEIVLREARLADWDGFAKSWSDLGIDAYMADGGRYRRRRHAALSASSEGIVRKPHQPHYQSRDYNPLNGGLERWFAPVADAIAARPAMQAILRTCFELFNCLTPQDTRPSVWHVEIHQFRIEAHTGMEGRPTPEGLHRDGVDWVLVLLIARENVASGMTSIHDLARQNIGNFTLTRPFDAAFVDDARVYHGVTPVEPLDPARPAYRDVLVVTFRR
jgi:hypothetical protein